jgi:hypothetical protein
MQAPARLRNTCWRHGRWSTRARHTSQEGHAAPASSTSASREVSRAWASCQSVCRALAAIALSITTW